MMKKILLLALLVVASTSVFAQRIAVLEFKAGVGISQEDVDGISSIFVTYFRPEGYTLVERTSIDKVIDEQQMQRSKLTESQMVRIGQLLNVSKVVVGDINIVMGQYNVDVRVLNVESGTISAADGSTFERSNFREKMKGLADAISKAIAITPKSDAEFVDLNLPSGTLWTKKIFKEESGNIEFSREPSSEDRKLPSEAQWKELWKYCEMTVGERGITLKGSNGNELFLPFYGDTGELRFLQIEKYSNSRGNYAGQRNVLWKPGNTSISTNNTYYSCYVMFVK